MNQSRGKDLSMIQSTLQRCIFPMIFTKVPFKCFPYYTIDNLLSLLRLLQRSVGLEFYVMIEFL